MITVVVPAYNAAATIGHCLAALQQQEQVPGPFEVLVVDDGSTDGTAALAAAAGARVITQVRQGPSAARNSGLRAAQGELTCFTDADCVPTPRWMAEILAPLLADPAIVAVKGAYCTRQRQLTARFVQLEYEEKYARLQAHRRIQFLDFYSAACRRQVLLDSGGFDERYTNSEDRELSYRLVERGHEMVFQPQATVCHIHAYQVHDYFQKKMRNGFWTAHILRRHPARVWEDTYTPQLMKAQIALMGLALAALVGGLLIPPLLALAAGAAVLFFLTTLPFSATAWRRDPPMVLVAPFMLSLRALALGLGYAAGLARPLRDDPS